MDDQPTFLTFEGHRKLQEELDYLRTEKRQQVALRLHEALGEGSLLENAELEDARNEQSFVEGRIRGLERMLSGATIIEEEQSRDSVGLGSRVTVVEGDGLPETYHIAGSAETDPSTGHISNASPLGRELMGRKVGDEAEVNAPGGVLVFKIVGIK